ncbi:S8 family serine peptidase [Longispora urticae]
MRPSPLAAALALGITAATLSASVPAAAAATPPPAPKTGSMVTLITGDRAVVGADGSAYLVPADRADGGYTTRTVGRNVYLVPDRAADLVRAGRLDQELFNVTGLVAQGYDDAHRRTTPLIVTGGTLARGAAPAGRALPSVGASAVEAAKDGTFWTSFTAPALRAAPGKVWLDKQVKGFLDRSTAQIGAPQAWAAGYDGTGTTVAVLDTGYDSHHPDLAGRVSAARDFTDNGSPEDGNGHGTHVASTVAGTGAASGGLRKGVAPGATLLVGKVLDDGGSGQESWIISAMEWAVDQGADVVSMSLGSAESTDCTDPMSMAAERLSAQSKSLFVIAAGNAGHRETVNSPGCAAGVLTVGAVDRDDTTANFSSRGPVLGSHRVKPDIAAPGVNIMAAAAGSWGGNAYRAMSGTSMATPHVAGAAAILAQSRPELSAQDRKATLMSSAKSGGTVYEQGAGVVNIPRAIGQMLIVDSTLDMGAFVWPQDGLEPVTKDLTYRNLGDVPVTLALRADGFVGVDGRPVPARLVRLGRTSVTVPAHGTATVPVTVDPGVRLKEESLGELGGRVTATGPGVTVSTAVGAWFEPKSVTLTVKFADRLGAAPASPSFLDVISTDVAAGERRYLGSDTETFRLRAGTYSINTMIATPDVADGLPYSVAYLGDPEIKLHEDTTLVYDARRTTKVRTFGADQPVEMGGALLQYGRWWDDRWTISGGVSTRASVRELYTSPTSPVRKGGFELGTFLRMYAPELDLRADGLKVDPVPVSGAPKLDGRGGSALVDGGAGTVEDLAAAKGKVAIVHLPADGYAGDVLDAAAQAGVTAVLLGREGQLGRWADGARGATVPGYTVSLAEEKALRRAGRVSWTATADSPYVYNLAFVDDRAVSPLPWHWIGERQLARVTERWHGQRVAGQLDDFLSVRRPHLADAGFIGGGETVATGRTRTAYYSPGSAWVHGAASQGFFGEVLLDVPRTYQPGEKRDESWYKGPMRSGINHTPDGRLGLASERQGNLIGAALSSWSDAQPGHNGYGNFGDIGNATLYRDGEDLGSTGWPAGVWEVPAAAADFRLVVDTQRFNPGPPFHTGWEMFLACTTEFRFRSARTTGDAGTPVPLLWPTYDVPVDLLNLAPAVDRFAFTVGAVGQAGYTPGRVTLRKAEVSYDDGVTWVATGVRGGTVTVDNRPAAGKWVSLRVALDDPKGASVTQTIVRAYGVK